MKTLRLSLLAAFAVLLAGPVAAQNLFTDVTGQVIAGVPYAPRGSAFSDCDNDGLPDLFLSPSLDQATGRLELWTRGSDGHFLDHRDALPLPAGMVTWNTWPSAPIFGDYDNDGDQDLYVSLGCYLTDFASANLLLRNDQGQFHEVAKEAGLTDVLPTDNAIWLDYDRDGYLDLYTGNPAAAYPTDPTVRNKLYRNRGDGTFADVTQEAGLDLAFNPEAGGTNGGMAAADFDNDGWTDLYVGVFEAPNHLFLNDTHGGFRDVTTPAIGDPGEAFGVAVGDIDNDGDLDILQAAGGGGKAGRNPLLRNAGDGQFTDVLEEAGLSVLAKKHLNEAGFADLDNDGDLDLMTGNPPLLFLNQDDGTFVDETDRSGISHTAGLPLGLSFADYDLDGFVDVTSGGQLFHNNGNANHWLQVELMGTRSNRNGIGARLLATTGELRQLREMLGGRGYSQDELVAHFGLGPRTVIDRLEVRWPSGQVDVLESVAADQRIRMVEGSGGFYPVHPIRYEITAPDSALAGAGISVSASVQPALFSADARITRVVADLSAVGGPAALPLTDQGDGNYRLDPTTIVLAGQPGSRSLAILIEQTTSAGPQWSKVAKGILVAPATDLEIFGDRPGPGWLTPVLVAGTALDAQEQGVVYQGQTSLKISANGNLMWEQWATEPLATAGYKSLRFRFHPGDVSVKTGGYLSVKIVSYSVTLGTEKAAVFVSASFLGSGAPEQIKLDLAKKEWQQVEIPLSAFKYQGSGSADLIQLIRFQGSYVSGTFGTFYLDDIRLVAATPANPPSTVVLEDYRNALPPTFTLSQNYPNPFNSQTVIHFALPASAEVELTLYNLAGQQVATMIQGRREAGAYTLHWDGRDERGRELSSGVYLYQLRAGAQVETRKLVLMR